MLCIIIIIIIIIIIMTYFCEELIMQPRIQQRLNLSGITSRVLVLYLHCVCNCWHTNSILYVVMVLMYLCIILHMP